MVRTAGDLRGDRPWGPWRHFTMDPTDGTHTPKKKQIVDVAVVIVWGEGVVMGGRHVTSLCGG